MKIEAQKNEIVIKNSAGDFAIIPADMREDVMKMINSGRFDLVDEIVSNLPKHGDYAEDGQLIDPPGDGFWKGLWHGIKTSVNPKNWGKPDMSNENNFGTAYQKARSAGSREFTYKGKRYDTNYAGTPEQQLRETGITDDQLQGQNFLKRKFHENIEPYGYDDAKERVKTALFKDKSDAKKEFDDSATFHRPAMNRNDAWNLYMGVPQVNNTFTTSQYKPSKSQDPTAMYFTFSDTNLKEKLLKKALDNKSELDTNTHAIMDDIEADVMGNYKVSVGKDDLGNYISFYDKWDLDPFSKGDKAMQVGKPFEIYDRIYYKERSTPNLEEISKKEAGLKSLEGQFESIYGDMQRAGISEEESTLLQNRLDKLTVLYEKAFDDLERMKEPGFKMVKTPLNLNGVLYDKLDKQDVSTIQKDLSSKGYKLPKSIREDGSFDGIWGEETEAALKDWQSKNK